MRARPTLLLLGVLAAGCSSSSGEKYHGPDVPPPLQTNRAPLPDAAVILPVTADTR